MFREFLRCEYSEENILFWMACEDLKKETSPEKVEEKARMIYEDYVSILSPREVFCLLINCTLLCKGCWLNYEHCLQLKLRIERQTSVLWNLQLLFPFNNGLICNGRKKIGFCIDQILALCDITTKLLKVTNERHCGFTFQMFNLASIGSTVSYFIFDPPSNFYFSALFFQLNVIVFSHIIYHVVVT